MSMDGWVDGWMNGRKEGIKIGPSKVSVQCYSIYHLLLTSSAILSFLVAKVTCQSCLLTQWRQVFKSIR